MPEVPITFSGPVYYNRLKEVAPELEEEFRTEIDPNHYAPYWPKEHAANSEEKKQRAAEILEAARDRGINLGTIINSRNKVNYEGHKVSSVAPGQLGVGDERYFQGTSGVRSVHNLVEPLYPLSLKGPDHPQAFDKRVDQLIREAQSFVFFRSYELERRDRVDLLIEKAKQGVQVEILIHPAEKAVRVKEQKAMLELLREAASEYPNLHVMEADLVPVSRQGGYEQIMHEKQVVADTPDGLVGEVEGGINHGSNSSNNFDSATYTEGVAVLDSLQRFISYLPRDVRNRIDLSRIPSHEDVRERIIAKAKEIGSDLTTIDLGGSGKRYVEPADHYSRKELRRRAELGQRMRVDANILVDNNSDRGQFGPLSIPIELSPDEIESRARRGRDIYLSVQQLFPRGLTRPGAMDTGISDHLSTAIENAGAVTIVIPPGTAKKTIEEIEIALAPLLDRGAKLIQTEINEENEKLIEQGASNGSYASVVLPSGIHSRDSAAWSRRLRDLKKLDVEVIKEDTVIRDESYRMGLYRELDIAIKRKESIDVGAFALTDSDIIKKLVTAHLSGCPVRVVVDDLEISNLLINRKAWVALSQVGIPVKVFTNEVARQIADWTEHPELVKLHAKDMIIGLTRGDGGTPEPRVAKGSANFSKSGLISNVEGGRIIRSAEVAKALTEALIDRVWDVAIDVEPTMFVDDSQRVEIVPPVPLDTPIDDVAMLGFDLETMGLAAQFGDYPLSVSTVPAEFSNNGETMKVSQAVPVRNTYFELPNDELGRFMQIPDDSFKIHGITRDRDTGETFQVLYDEDGRPDRRKIDTIPISEGLRNLRDDAEALRKAKGAVILVTQNGLQFDIPQWDTTAKNAKFPVDGVNYKFTEPTWDLIAMDRELYPHSKRPRKTPKYWGGHNLDAIAYRHGLSSAERGTHTSEEDTALTVIAFAQEEVKVWKLARGLGKQDPNLAKWAGRLITSLVNKGISGLKEADRATIQELVVEYYAQDWDRWSEISDIDSGAVKELREQEGDVPEHWMALLDQSPEVLEKRRDIARPLVAQMAARVADAVLEYYSKPDTEPVTVGDLLAPDTVRFHPGDVMLIGTSPRNPSGSVRYKVEQHHNDTRILEKNKDGTWGEPRRVETSETKVLGVTDNNTVHIQFTVGTGSAAIRYEGYVNPEDVKFWQGGKVAYTLRERGFDITPGQLRPGRAYRGEVAPTYDTGAALYSNSAGDVAA